MKNWSELQVKVVWFWDSSPACFLNSPCLPARAYGSPPLLGAKKNAHHHSQNFHHSQNLKLKSKKRTEEKLKHSI
jgi:hypothetical protein